MKLKHFVISWIIVVQLIGCTVGYYYDSSLSGIAQGWMGSVCVFLAIAANVIVVSAIWQDMD